MTLYPYSTEFAEHYWSGGAPEKTHVFLHGNHLPQRFSTAQEFTVAELGFGTALNFLLTLQLWHNTAPPQAHLTYIAYEIHPISPATLAPIHAAFPAGLQTLSEKFLTLYNPQPGWNTLSLPNTTLHLYAGDATLGLPTQTTNTDAWFLDGFSPANNPQLWHPTVMNEVYRLTHPNGTASTYSVARLVRDALTTAGFQIQRTPGHPPKGQMLQATKR